MKAMFVILLFGRCCEHNCEGGKFTVREDNSGGEKSKGEILSGRKYFGREVFGADLTV